MKSRIFAIFALLLFGSFCQISLIGFLNQGGSSTTLPRPTPTITVIPSNPTIPVVNSADNFASPADSPNFVPCNGQQFCGEAQPFGSASQFDSFVSQNSNTDTTTISALPASTNLRSQSGLSAPTARTQSFAFQSLPQPTAFQSLPQPAANRDFSGTNNQEENVDEADLLKTDGTYIYTISNRVLSIILAYPVNNARVVSQVTLEYTPSAIFQHGSFLAVFGTQYGYNYKNVNYASSGYTFIKIYNIANKANPFLVREYQFLGNYFNARKLNSGFVYIISNYFFTRNIIPWCDWGSGKVDVWFGNIYRYPVTYVQVQGINILSFNLGNPLNGGRKIISICAQAASILYMSENSIYLSNTVFEQGRDHTVIRKVFVRNLNIVPFGDAKVRGTVNNQFSLDQYGQFLRVATTNNQGGDQWNNVYTLDYYCRSYGVLTRIAPGERIYSARYIDKRLYLVTFRQVDPFFVISFASFRAPIILGELKITGYSSYLHPYDETTILGFGRDATTSGVVGALKIALFDVADPRNPRLLSSATVTEAYAASSAEWEHKAFLFSRERNILVVPGSLNNGQVKFNGAFVFSVARTSISISGMIDHLVNANDNFSIRTVERSLYIENILYTKSKCLLRINRIDSQFTAVSNINIPCGQSTTGVINPVGPFIRPAVLPSFLPSILPAIQPLRN